MLHLKNYATILVSILVLVSCNNDQPKEKDVDDIAVTTQAIAPPVKNNEAFNAAVFNEAYISSITQTFTAKRKSVSVITGKKGLKVTVNPASLETMDGQPVTGDITVKMIELTTSGDLFKSNAATVSNGKLLASGGSYYVGMECNGKQLRVKGRQSVQMEFPKIKEGDMELFYGDKDKEGNINWVKAEQPLAFNYDPPVRNAYNPPFPGNEERKRFMSKFKMYKSPNDKIYFDNKLITILQFAQLLQSRGVDKNIDTMFIPSYEFYYGLQYNSKFKYDAIKRYRIVSCQDIEDDIAYRTVQRKITEERDMANRKYYDTWWKANSLEGQIQDYYAPSSVGRLGWINCDRFYQAPQLIETPVEIPYTFNNPSIQYFLIYNSFNGLMSGRLEKNEKQQYVLSGLPPGEKVTIVAFAKQNGVVYNCKEEFTITAGKTIKPDFKIVSAEEMNKIFGSNIRI